MRTISFLVLLSILIASCSNTAKNNEGKPVVTVSLLPQKYWVDRLASDFVETNVMVVAGAGHSTYEPTPEQMRKITKSDIYFKIGHIDFEYTWMKKFMDSNPAMKVVDLSEGFDLSHVEAIPCTHDHGHGTQEHHHHGVDPHIWLNPPMVKEMVEKIAQHLRTLVPEKAGIIREREKRFLIEIDSLDNYITERLASIENRKFLLFHPALTWYAYNYNLEQIVIEVDGKEPSPSKMKEIVQRVKSENIKVVLIQNEFPFERALAIAKETNAEVFQIKPLDYNWLSNMFEMTDIVEKALIKSQQK
jgi:zinc transport system substrate-binding protein